MPLQDTDPTPSFGGFGLTHKQADNRTRHSAITYARMSVESVALRQQKHRIHVLEATLLCALVSFMVARMVPGVYLQGLNGRQAKMQ